MCLKLSIYFQLVVFTFVSEIISSLFVTIILGLSYRCDSFTLSPRYKANPEYEANPEFVLTAFALVWPGCCLQVGWRVGGQVFVGV